MASEDIVLRIKAKMDTGDVSGAVKDLQAAFNRMNLTGNVKEEFNKTFKDLIKSAETFENKAKGSFEKVADLNALKKSSKEVESLFNGLLKDLKRLSSQDSDDIFEFDLSGIKKMNEEIDSLTKKAKTAAASAVDIEKVGTALKSLSKMTSKKEGFGLLENLKVGDLGAATADFQKLQGHLKNFAKGSETAKSAVNEFLAALDSGDVDQINAKLDVLTNNIKTIGKGDTGNLLFFADGLKDIAIQLQKAATTTQEFQREIDGIRANNMEDLLNQTRLSVNALEAFVRAAHQGAEGSRQFGMNVNDAASGVHNLSTEINDIKQRAVSFLSLENSIDLFKQGVRKAIDTVKELDKAMAETAVVTDFSIGDMWDKLPEYTKMANELGVATQGVYEASTLYYQQGLQTEQVMALTTETLKMARIAGLDCAEATDLMTAALRGFNMEINETNAQRVNDVYSELAAITAADTQEIATAMTKTASIAHSANMELETTAALLAQMIETTREPAETAGTAMKTIVARFTEMKKAVGDTVTVEGEEVSVNKVEEALKSAGVALRDANGEFRDLDDVLLELASKWDSLDIMTQRYIATTAAGSRQQSRFIAMMQDYDRTVELVDAAYNSAGSSSEQFAKTQESLESKLARLKNAWDTFLMGIADDQIIKGFIDALTKLIDGFNKLSSGIDGIGGSILRIGVAFGGLRLAKSGVEKAVTDFINLKNSINGVGDASKKLNILQSLTQKIKNFKSGKGFVVDANIETGTAHAKLAKLRADVEAFYGAVRQPVSSGATVGFQELDGKMVVSSITAEGATESIELNLSEVGNAALLASEECKEVGKGLVKSGISGKAALDVLQKEYAETIALANMLNAANDGDIVEFGGKKFQANAESRKYFNNKAASLQGDIANTTQAMSKTGSGSSGSWATGFTSMFKSLAPMLKILLVIAAVVGVIAAGAAILYNLSPLRKAKNEAEAAKVATENYNRALEDSKKETEALNNILSELESREEVFDSLIVGSGEWYTAIQETNSALLQQIELLSGLGYEIGYTYDKNGMIVLDDEQEVRQAQIEASKRQNEIQKQATVMQLNQEVAELKESFTEAQASAGNKGFVKGVQQSFASIWDGSFFEDLSYTNDWKDFIAWGAGGLSATILTGPFMGLSPIISEIFVDGLNSAVEEVDEYGGVYGSLNQQQKEELDLLSRKNAMATWSLYAEDEKASKAGQKVISLVDNAYEVFYAGEASADWGDKFKVDEDWNPELTFEDGTDITVDDLDEVIEDLGYEDWNQVATALGLKWDESVGGYEGLYRETSDGEKQYMDISNHGMIDNADEWTEWMTDPNSTNIDAGYVAYMLSFTAPSSNPSFTLTDFITGHEDEILYGTDDWTDVGVSGSEIEQARALAINESNQRKRDIYDSIINTTDQDGNLVFDFSPQLDLRVKKTPYEDETLRQFASNIQKLEVDTNFTTAAGYQAFIASKAAEFDNFSAEDLQNLEDTYYNIFKEIDLENATYSLDALNEMIEDGVEGAQELKDNLTMRGGALDLSSQFATLLADGTLDAISEEISKISDTAGNIDVSATRELVDSNVALKNIMDEFNISGYAMGKILTDIQSGELTLTEINEGLIESYKLLYAAMGQAEDVLYDLRNADLGEDYTEIGRTYEERYQTIQDLYDRGAFGSENFAGNIKSLIGEDEWERYLSEAGNNARIAWENIASDYYLGENDGNLYGSFSSLINTYGSDVFGIDEQGRITYNFDVKGINTYDDILDHMVDAFGISREYAKAMLADMATYSETLQADLDSLNSIAYANEVYGQMYHEYTGEDIIGSYTELTNQELYRIFGGTDQWFTAEAEAKEKYGEGWDTLDLQEQTDLVAENFKYFNKIYNTFVDDGGVERNIEKVDSQGNIYYYDDEQELQIQVNDENVSTNKKRGEVKERVLRFDSDLDLGDVYVPTEDEGNSRDGIGIRESERKDRVYEERPETDQEYAERLSQDEEVIRMATELNDEEYQAWLKEVTGEENAPQMMIEAGFSQDAIAGAEQMKNEMIAKITGVVDALKAVSVTIPVSFPMLVADGTGGVSLQTVEGNIVIGGEGTGYTINKEEGYTQQDIDSAIAEHHRFTQGQNNGSGTGYSNGDDPTNGGNTGGGATEADKLNYAEENSNRQLEALERIRKGIDREAELIDKLPEEIAGPLKLLNMGEQMLAEYKEIQINKNKLAALELEEDNAQAEAEYLGEYYYYDEFLESYMYDVEKMEGASPETAVKVQEEYNELQELRNKINEVNDELDGGKIQKIVKGLAKASTATSKALKGTEKASDMLNDAFGDLAEKFGLADELDRLGKSIDKAIDESEFLKREFKGLGIVSEETLSKIDNLPLGDATKDLIKNTLGTNENGTIGSWLGDAFGAGGEMLGGMGDLLNFDMMSMGLDMFNGMKDMAQKMIQYVVQFVQTIINWWINREDWLYNLLSAIEQEVHNFNRQEQVEERFRLYSDEGLNDLVSAWEAMRESLEKQIDLNEQLIKSRQAELQFLNLTNLPFSPAFYYDYTEERVIENPWVYDIYILLLDIGAMIPEIGGIFSSIKQLMEDNKKRMEEAVEEIEDAREEILELEKKQLELRTKYMEDEIELEELVMDTIIEKQQEEIDELTAMNDAITAGNEKLIATLNSKLDLIRQQRDNEDKEEELGEKERRLAYLRQDTSNANRAEIYDLQDELKDERRDYTDELIDQKISALEEQNEKAAEQRQKQIDLLQAQLDHTEKYGLQWTEAQTLIKNGFDSEGRLRVGTDLFDMLMSKEEFTSMGLGSTRQTQQIMDWNVTSIAAAAFREINDIWDEGFGNFAMSNDVHDQSRLHLWADRDIEYRQLPSWLGFLQPAYNTIQDYLWRTGNNVETFVETGFLSGKNSSSILGKTIVPLIQGIAGNIESMANDYKSLSIAETGDGQSHSGAIPGAFEGLNFGLGERIIKGVTDGIVSTGENIVSGFKGAIQSNSISSQNRTQNNETLTVNQYFNNETDGETAAKSFIDAATGWFNGLNGKI